MPAACLGGDYSGLGREVSEDILLKASHISVGRRLYSGFSKLL